jgi:hypothetical protein
MIPQVFSVSGGMDTLTPTDAPDYDPTEDLRTLEALWLQTLSPFEPAGYHRPKA